MRDGACAGFKYFSFTGTERQVSMSVSGTAAGDFIVSDDPDGKNLLDHIKVMDLCAIFGNALDNSIEHVMKIPEADRRLIHVTVSEKSHFICILVENYYVGKAFKDGELPATTKKNTAYHGYGLKSIKFTVEQYGGALRTSLNDHWFRLEILLPMKT